MLWPDEVWPQEIGCLAVLDGVSLFDPGGASGSMTHEPQSPGAYRSRRRTARQ
jgi:hypothetical protein